MRARGWLIVALASACARPDTEVTQRGSSATAVSCKPESPETSERERRLIELVNEARGRGVTCPEAAQSGLGGRPAAESLSRLTVSPKLSCAARLNSADMAKTGHFAHFNLEGDGPGARARRAGYTGRVLENLAWGQESERGVLDAWLASPAHCRALATGGQTEIGVGLSLGAAGKPFWTLLLGSG